MFDPVNLKGLRLAEVEFGQLVAAEVDGQRSAGIVVQTPGEEDQKGVLFFPPNPWASALSSMPVFAYPRDQVIHMGCAAEFRWSGQLSGLADAYQTLSPGHLVVTPSGLCLSGRIPTGMGNAIYWHVASGRLSKNQNVMNERSVFIREWRVGWRDMENEFHELSHFPVE